MRPSSTTTATTLTAILSLPTTTLASSSSTDNNLTNNRNKQTISSSILFPPFNSSDSKLISKCSLRAQQKQKLNQLIDKTSSSLSLLEQFGEDKHYYGSPPINNLPIRQVRYEHAHRRGALYCQSGTWLEMTGDINGPVYVRGNKNQNNRLTIFEFLAVAFGLVSIKAIENQHFLCMNSKGQLYAASENQFSAECVFLEEMHPQVYNLYSSCAHGYPKRPWFVALSRTGKPRRGKRTRRGQSSTHFVLKDGGGGRDSNRQEEGGNPLDSLGHAQSKADWLINWKNFYEIDHKHKIRGRKKLTTSNKNNINKKNRLRWELLQPVVDELRKRRRSNQKIIKN